MISLATTFFWIFLIAFFITAVYSVKDISFNIGDPQMSVKTDNELVFSLPVSITNRGFYNIGAFSIKTQVLDKEGFILTQASTLIPVIRKNNEVIINHNMTANVTELLQRCQNYLFNDTELSIYAALGLRIAEMIPVEASANFSMLWGAPLYNFSLGEIQYSVHNSTHVRVVVPISFENHSFFDIVGSIHMQMYNNTDVLIGEGEARIEAWSNMPYDGFIELFVQIIGVTETGRFEVYFLTSIFEYGPLVIPYG